MTTSSKIEAPATRGIRHVAFVCADLARMESFYCDVMGYRVEWRPSESDVYLTRGEDTLALHAGTHESQESRLDHIGLVVSALEGVDEWAGYLRARGIGLAKEPRTHRDGARSLYLRDPEGNVVQILYHPSLAL